MFTLYSIKRARKIRFHVAGLRATTAKKCTKKHNARARLFFCWYGPISFCRSRCRRRHHCLSSLLLWSRNFATMVTRRHTSPLCWTSFTYLESPYAVLKKNRNSTIIRVLSTPYLVCLNLLQLFNFGIKVIPKLSCTLRRTHLFEVARERIWLLKDQCQQK